MEAMENFELLSDDQLRVRLQQYGFANLPVTDTTRKVLVKKLRLAVEGQNTKTRRETVAVSKFSSDEEPDKEQKVRGAKKEKAPNRRATTAASEKVVTIPITLSDNGGLSNGTPSKTSRRSSRATPSKDKPSAPTTAYVTSLQEDTDEDVIEVPVTRRSRTPSMGKSETVRTSYKTTVNDSFVEEQRSYDYEDDEDEEPIIAPVEQKTTIRRKTYSSSAATIPTKVQDKSTPSKFGRASLTTSYNPRGNYNFENEDEEPLELNESNTPYLSNFAKRLSHLKAEPLDSGMDKYKAFKDDVPSTATSYKSYQQPSYSYKNDYKSAPATRPAVRKTGASKDLAQMFESLDRQYNFRTILYVSAIVMIIVAIYVIFM